MEKKYRDKEWLRERYIEEGASMASMADECGVSSRPIQYWLEKFDLKNKQKYKNEEWLRNKTKKGLSQEKMGEMCGASGSTIGSWQDKYGIESNFGAKTQNEFEEEVNKLVGDGYTVLGEYKNTDTKILMRHNECGHEYRVIPDSFLRGNRCPECKRKTLSRKNKKSHKKFKKEALNILGSEYSILGQYEESKKKILIQHKKCGYRYKVYPNMILDGWGRCPVCYTSYELNTEVFVMRVKMLVGDEYTVVGEYKNNSTKIEMKHNKCGNHYMVTPRAFFIGNRCPACKYRKSKGEKAIARFSKSNSLHFDTEVTFDDCNNDKSLFFDFKYINGDNIVLVEHDGKQHYKPVNYFGGKQQWKKQVRRDRIKDNFALSNNIPLLRVNYMDRDNGTLIDKVEEFLIENNILTN